MGRLKAGKTPIDGYAIEKAIKNQNLNFDVLQKNATNSSIRVAKTYFRRKSTKTKCQ